jgi:hypothetical protein
MKMRILTLMIGKALVGKDININKMVTTKMMMMMRKMMMKMTMDQMVVK